jgi:hypothetical protein
MIRCAVAGLVVLAAAGSSAPAALTAVGKLRLLRSDPLLRQEAKAAKVET